MKRFSIVPLFVALLTGCATHSSEFKRTVTISGQKCCVKHRIPLISVRGFQVKPTLLVHCGTERCATCDERTPNRIEDREHLLRTHLHSFRAVVTYCPLCEAEFVRCVAEHQLSDRDIQEIRAVVSHRSDVRQSIIRIVPVDTNRALVDTGAEGSIGEVFDEFGITRRDEGWYISSSIDAHKIIAVGQ